MGLDLNYINGQTPLDDDEKEGLKILTITTRGDLDEFEQLNIQKAVEWSLKNKFKVNKIINEDFIRTLHVKMFDEVWSWAGQFRKSNKNIGVDKFQISIELKNLIDDSLFWIENNTFDADEIVIRFSHRIVQIHLFPNGNGRHSRLFADILINHAFGRPIYTWGAKNLVQQNENRIKYLEALRDADKGSYNNLIKFARS